jgi:hypothetical protein
MAEDLDTRMQEALKLIAEGYGIEKACHKAGISTKTFYKLKKEEKWREKYFSAREIGLKMSGISPEKAEEMIELHKNGVRIEKRHQKNVSENDFDLIFLAEKCGKGISNETERIYEKLGKCREIVENAFKNPFSFIFYLFRELETLNSLLQEILLATQNIDKENMLLRKKVESMKISQEITEATTEAEWERNLAKYGILKIPQKTQTTEHIQDISKTSTTQNTQSENINQDHDENQTT